MKPFPLVIEGYGHREVRLPQRGRSRTGGRRPPDFLRGSSMTALDWVRERARQYEEEVIDFTTGRRLVKRFHFGGRMKYGMVQQLKTATTEITDRVYETLKINGVKVDYYRTEYEEVEG